MLRFLRHWPATSLVVLALLVTYAIGLPLAIVLGPVEAALGIREELLSLWLMRWGPTLAGFVVLAAVAGRQGFGVWLRQLVRWRVPAGYYVFVYGVALLLFVVSLVLSLGWSTVEAALPPAASLPELSIAYVGEIIYVTLTNGEETGWRFVLLGLLLVRMRLFPAALLAGGAWVIWHLPMYLWLGAGGIPMFAPFVFVGLGLSILLAWLYKATDSLLLPILFHGAVNATTYTFERHFSALADALEGRGPVGEWMYVVALVPVVLAVLLSRRRLFFGQPGFRHAENWAGRAFRSGGHRPEPVQ